MELKRGSTSRVGDIIVNEYNWMGQSDAVGKADPNLLFSRTSKSYAYLFKFVIKANGMSEEIIYQPAILKVKLVGAQNFWNRFKKCISWAWIKSCLYIPNFYF